MKKNIIGNVYNALTTCLPNIYIHLDFADHLSTSICKCKLWMPWNDWFLYSSFSLFPNVNLKMECLFHYDTKLLAFSSGCVQDEHCTLDDDKSICDTSLNACVGKVHKKLKHHHWKAQINIPRYLSVFSFPKHIFFISQTFTRKYSTHLHIESLCFPSRMYWE